MSHSREQSNPSESDISFSLDSDPPSLVIYLALFFVLRLSAGQPSFVPVPPADQPCSCIVREDESPGAPDRPQPSLPRPLERCLRVRFCRCRSRLGKAENLRTANHVAESHLTICRQSGFPRRECHLFVAHRPSAQDTCLPPNPPEWVPAFRHGEFRRRPGVQVPFAPPRTACRPRR